MNRFSLRHYSADRRGVVLIEFAVVLPVLLFLTFVGLEFISFQLARIKVDKAAYMIANAVTQLPSTSVKNPAGDTYRTVEDAQLLALLREADNLLPRATRARAKVVVSNFTQIDQVNDTMTSPPRDINAPLLLWARGWKAGEVDLDTTSTIPVVGSAIAWPSAVQMQRVEFTDNNTRQAIANYGQFRCGENVVMVEVFYEYEPIFTLFADVNLLQRQTMVSRSFLRPRTGDIEALAGNASFAVPAALYQTTKKRDGFCR